MDTRRSRDGKLGSHLPTDLLSHIRGSSRHLWQADQAQICGCFDDKTPLDTLFLVRSQSKLPGQLFQPRTRRRLWPEIEYFELDSFMPRYRQSIHKHDTLWQAGPVGQRHSIAKGNTAYTRLEQTSLVGRLFRSAPASG